MRVAIHSFPGSPRLLLCAGGVTQHFTYLGLLTHDQSNKIRIFLGWQLPMASNRALTRRSSPLPSVAGTPLKRRPLPLR